MRRRSQGLGPCPSSSWPRCLGRFDRPLQPRWRGHRLRRLRQPKRLRLPRHRRRPDRRKRVVKILELKLSLKMNERAFLTDSQNKIDTFYLANCFT